MPELLSSSCTLRSLFTDVPFRCACLVMVHLCVCVFLLEDVGGRLHSSLQLETNSDPCAS